MFFCDAWPERGEDDEVPREPYTPFTPGIVILLMGQTGGGKSHFINSAAGRKMAPVRHGLTSDDFKVQSFTVDNPRIEEVENPRSKVILVDTPGLNNGRADVNDIEIIGKIGAWLNDHCEDGDLFAGIIFVHDITEDRANVYADAHAWPIKYLSSPAVLQHLVLTTGKWDLDVVKKNPKRYVEREQDLKDMPAWRRLLNRGASLSRYEGNHDTAWEAINKLLDVSAVRVGLVRKDFNILHAKLPNIERPKAPTLMRLARVFSELTLNFESLTITRTVDEEGRRKVTVVAAGNLEILNGAQNVQIETVTVTSAGRDFVTHNTTIHNYHFHAPVTVVVGSDAAATRQLHGLPRVEEHS